MLKNIILLCLTIINKSDSSHYDRKWDGKWFPNLPNIHDSNPTIPFRQNNLIDPNHGIKMGIKDPSCDDGKTNLIRDWFMNPDNYTCLDNRKKYLPNSYIHPLHTIERIPPYYSATHLCMKESIRYEQIIPTFGTHRPLWPVYGEYQFVPTQRWLHSLEHGGVVMLYHPCAEKNEVNLLKEIVKNCLYKHVITPYNLLEPTRPLVLVTWGHRLEMSRVATDLAVKFIKDHALQGPEDIERDGQYSLLLLNRARIVSDAKDTNLCPGLNKISITMK